MSAFAVYIYMLTTERNPHLQRSPVQPCDGLQSALDIGSIHGCDVCKEGVVAVAVILRLLFLLDELSCWQAPARATLRLYIRATPTSHIYIQF